MLPTNVMSFMKKMVATDESPTQQHQQQQQAMPENTGTFGKIKATLLTAQDKVTNKMSPRPSLIPDLEPSYQPDFSAYSNSPQQQHPPSQQQQQTPQQPQPATANKAAELTKPPSRAGACRVCLKSFKPDDYSKTCFECHQRVCEDCASYSKLDESDDASTWRCSVCRRKMASRVCIPQDSTDSMLDVPILDALQRRHSDVKLSSSSNLTTSNGSGLAPPRSPELRRHSDVSPASLKELEKLKSGTKTPGGDLDWRQPGRSAAPSRANSPPKYGGEFDQGGRGSRRPSAVRVPRQHSYDDDVKNAANAVGAPMSDLGLGLPSPMPRRKSAYDVFAPGLTGQPPQNARPGDVSDRPPSRRPSFRALPTDESIQNDHTPSPDQNSPTLCIDDSDRRMRRRGSQLPDIAALRDRGALPIPSMNAVPYQSAVPNLEDLEAPRRQTSMDGEAIKIVIHDVDSGPTCASKRRVILRRDPADKAHRTRGFGMRVVGGKTGADGRLFAYIVWTVPGGPAEKGGLQQGDKILEWGGMSLVDRSFEEVCSIMDRTGEVCELLVEHATDFRMCDLLEDGGPPNSGGGGGGGFGGMAGAGGPRKSGDGAGLGLVADTEPTVDKSPSSPTRRKLPKTPEQLAREKLVSGRVQLQVWYHGERNELVVSLMAGDDLQVRDDTLGYGNQPEAYAKVRILPKTGDGHVAQTEVSKPTQNPIWNATLTFGTVLAENLMDRHIEVVLWDLVPQCEPVFLGECSVDLQKAFLDDRAVWYRLEDPKGLRSTQHFNKSPNVSPRGSLTGSDLRLFRRPDYPIQRSVSDDVDSLGDGLSLLHPDHAWQAGSRRGSSQSETLEVETYQLGKDFSRSLPGSRRSSFQDREEGAPTPPSNAYLRDRRRSSVRRDPDEILRSLKAVKGELGRTMSLQREQEMRSPSRRNSRSRKDSIMDLSASQLSIGFNNVVVVNPTITSPTISAMATSPPSDDDIVDNKWKVPSNYMPQTSTSTAHPPTISEVVTKPSPVQPKQLQKQSSLNAVKLGPGQLQPKGYRLTTGRYGELKMSFIAAKGILDVEVISARNIVPVNSDPPDTYVKCYIKDGERLRHKKKTRVVRHSAEPNFKQTLKYSTSDVFGRSLVIMVWQRCIGFEHNQGLGGAELYFDTLKLTQPTGGWYPLFPMHSLGSDSNDSP